MWLHGAGGRCGLTEKMGLVADDCGFWFVDGVAGHLCIFAA